MSDIKSCPFCGKPPEWLIKEMNFGTGASGSEAPQRALGCKNSSCAIRPHTKFRDTERWEQGTGYYKVCYDEAAIKEWNTRL